MLHRVLVNSKKPRISVASLHSFPLTSVVKPSPKLIDEHNQPQYMDTDFATFLRYISTREPKWKNFLESRKIHQLKWTIKIIVFLLLLLITLRWTRLCYRFMLCVSQKKRFMLCMVKRKKKEEQKYA